jgi:hypothetical protein
LEEKKIVMVWYGNGREEKIIIPEYFPPFYPGYYERN